MSRDVGWGRAGVGLGSCWGRARVELGSCWGPARVVLGSNWAVMWGDALGMYKKLQISCVEGCLMGFIEGFCSFMYASFVRAAHESTQS